MLKLYEFICSGCNLHFEDLLDVPIAVDAPQLRQDALQSTIITSRPPSSLSCPDCGSEAFRNPTSDPTGYKHQYDPARQKEIMMKGANIRNKLLGKVPWRKSSESQST